MQLRQITPKWTDRAVFIGQTGTGKSTLARYMLRSRPSVLVLDINDTLTWDSPDIDYPNGEYKACRNIDQIIEYQDYPRLIYKPPIEDSENFGLFDLVFKTVYLMGGITIYVDEAYAVTKNQSIPFYYKALLTRGRAKGIETWTSTQRPSSIPSFILSESEHLYCFKLQFPADVEKIYKYSGLEPDRVRTLPKRKFHYATGEDTIYNLSLNLKG